MVSKMSPKTIEFDFLSIFKLFLTLLFKKYPTITMYKLLWFNQIKTEHAATECCH